MFLKITVLFIAWITKNGREAMIPQIADSFESQLKAHKGIIPITLISAQTLDANTKAAIIAKVQATITGKLEVTEEIDTTLIGGFVVKMGDNRIDASVSNQLKNLKQSLTR